MYGDEVTEFKIRIACECYSDPDYVRDAVARLPDFGKLEWGSPCKPAAPYWTGPMTIITR